MPQNSFHIQEIQQLEGISTFLLENVALPSLILLNGNLGAGKTTFTKFFLKNFGLQPNQVKSPTYSLINNFAGNWQNQPICINHIDLYRLENSDSLLEQEIFQLLSEPNSLTLIEWPEKIDFQKVASHSLQIIEMNFTLSLDNSRQITVQIKP